MKITESQINYILQVHPEAKGNNTEFFIFFIEEQKKRFQQEERKHFMQ